MSAVSLLTPTFSPSAPLWAPEPDDEKLAPAEVFALGMKHHHIANTAYPIAHHKTVWRWRVDDPAEHAPLLQRSLEASDSMSLYVHVPFCEKRCGFCEYAVVPEHSGELERQYFAAVNQELDRTLSLFAPKSKVLAGFDIGGGTPALADPRHLARCVQRVTDHFVLGEHFDMSVETTPKIAAEDPARIQDLRALGFDRISMGLQMVNPKLLARYGRDTQDESFNPRAMESIRKAGFERCNIDLMYGFAHQSLDDVERSIRYTISLNPETITLYRMRYKGTRVHKEMDEARLDDIAAMHALAHDTLVDAGFAARLGKNVFSRLPNDVGTSAYLTSRVIDSTPYVGIGLGAQTFTNHVLAYNAGAASKRLKHYLEAVDQHELPIQDLYHLPPSEGMAKMLAVSFYFGAIDLAAFEARFGETLGQRFAAELSWVQAQGLMVQRGELVELTREGMHQMNGIIALFYSNRVKRHLRDLK